MKTIRIGLLDYEIRHTNGLSGANEEGKYTRYHGRVYYDDQVIEVEEQASAARQWATLWHETIHVLLEQAGIEEAHEQIVTVLGYGIPAVLQANPWMGAPHE